MNGKQFIFNAEYDFQLRNAEVAPHIRSSVELMAPLFIPALDPTEAILSDVAVSQDFYDYLNSNTISCAPLVPTALASKELPTEAWGWSESIIEQINNFSGTFTAPSPKICRVVNSRHFAHNHNITKKFGTPYSQVINSQCELLDYLDHHSFSKLVLKPFFGNSGAGFLFVDQSSPENDVRHARELVASEPVIIEPWLDRVNDFASVFEITQEGECRIIGHHRNICNSSGSFYGTLICKNDPELQQWIGPIEKMVFTTAKALHDIGYFGIVSIDSFTYLNDNSEQIALCVDINCRYTMSYIAHTLFRKIGSEALFYRFIAKRRHKLPETFDQLIDKLGDITYDKKSKRGVLMASPMRICGSDKVWRQPPRSAFCVTGNTIDELFEIDDQLRERIIY